MTVSPMARLVWKRRRSGRSRWSRSDSPSAGLSFCWHSPIVFIDTPTKGRGGCSRMTELSPTARSDSRSPAGRPCPTAPESSSSSGRSRRLRPPVRRSARRAHGSRKRSSMRWRGWRRARRPATICGWPSWRSCWRRRWSCGRVSRPGSSGRGLTFRRCSGADSRRRECHFADTPSPSLLIRLLKGEGGAAE